MTYTTTVSADAPLAWFHLDENVTNVSTVITDSGSEGGTATIGGTYSNLGSQQPPAGTMSGYSMHFNNNAGYLQKAVNTFTASTAMTLETWYKRDTGSAASVNNGTVIQFSGNSSGGVYWSIGSGGNFLLYIGGTLTLNTTATGALNDGNWHHVVVTINGTAVTVYVDGVSKATASTTSHSNTSGTFYVGVQATGIMAYLDEPAFYTTALTSTQVSDHYTAGTAAPSVSVTETPPVINLTNLTIPAPVVNVINPNVTCVVPVATASLATATPVVTGSTNITDAVPAMTLSLATASPAVSTTYQSVESASAMRGENGADNGTGTAFSGISGADSSVFIQFATPAIPTGKQITGSTLTFTQSSGPLPAGATIGYTVYRLTSAFTEGNYSTDPVGDATSITGAFTATTSPVTVNIDISSLVNLWESGTPNYGLAIRANGSGTVNSTDGRYIVLSNRTASASSAPKLTTAFQDIPPTPVSVIAPVMTASIADPAPVVTAQKNVSSTATIVDLGTVDLVAATDTVSTNVTTVAPVATASLSFLGGASFNPDYATTATVIAAGIATPNAKQFVEYDVLVQAPATYLGNLENEIASISLTTNRLMSVPPMSLSLKWPGIYIEGADRYLTKIATTLDQDDIWYKMDEASGNRAIDSEYEIITNQLGQVTNNAWQQSGYYVGNPTFRISDGPELRPAVHFDGIDDYMVVGPYTIDDTWTDARTDDVEQGMAVTIEFSIRTAQTDGVVFIGGGAGIAGLAAISPSYFSLPHVNGNELRLENGYLTIANKSGTKVKARQFISDGQWHHVVMAIPSSNAFVPNPTDPIQFDGRSPSYLAVDGQPTLVRYGNFLGDTQSYGNNWLPFVVGARTNDATWDDLANNKTTDVGANALLEMDMRDFIVRLNTYQQLKDTEVIYYEWSNSTVLTVDPMTVNMSTIDPFKVKGNMKKMLALYGLPWGYDYDGTMPLYTYASTLSGMVIEHFGSGSEHVPNGSTFNGHSPVYQTVKTFTVGDYLVYPVDLTGGAQNGGYTGGGTSTYATDVTSVPGVLDRSAPFMKEYPDGTGYGGFADDTTGLPRFINLQNDIADLSDFDLITAVNYPWETPMQSGVGGTPRQPADAQLCQGSLGMSGVEWTKARNDLRDSILQAAYDGASLWVGEYHMAQHLGFIGHYDVHDFGTARGSWDTHARDLDAAHGVDSRGYLGVSGEYYPGPQLMHQRRVTALIPGLTDLPTTEQGDVISGWSYDRWKANGDFSAGDIVRRPNGLQIGDLCKMGGDGFSGVAGVSDIPFVASGINYGWFNSSVGTRDPGSLDGRTLVRQSIISARPDEIVGTPVTREMTGYYGDSGVWFDNPYKDNVLTIAAEVGTVVRGRAIAGRAFIELMETNITPTFVTENQPLPDNQQTTPGVILRYSPSTFYSTWEADTRRDREVMATLNRTMLTALGGGFGVISSSINYMNFTSTPVIYHRRETMHSRGLNWLAQTRTLEAGDVAVYQTAFTLTLKEPSPAISKTSSETVQVSAMRLDMEVRQPKNYLSGDVEVRTLPAEMFLDMRGRGSVVQASAMTVGLATVGPVVLAATEIITVFLDSDSAPITLFLKEDN